MQNISHLVQRWQQRWRAWRPLLSRLVTTATLGLLVAWGWQNAAVLQQVSNIRATTLLGFGLLLSLGVLCAALPFTLLVRTLGYSFPYSAAYHSLNLSQIAAMMPGKIWGFTGLAGLLWARGVGKADSAMVIVLHSLFTLSTGMLLGSLGLLPWFGWTYSLYGMVPVLLIVAGRPCYTILQQRFFPQSTALPSLRQTVLLLIMNGGSWVLVAACFAWLVYSTVGHWPLSPITIGSAFIAGYLGGLFSLVTPAGLGVREGIITLILGPALGSDEALAFAMIFRVIHTAVLWLHVAITCGMLALTTNRAGESKEEKCCLSYDA